MKARVMIATGGTGGHVYPALAVAREIRHREPGCRITFVGRRDGIEREEFNRDGNHYMSIRVQPLSPRAGWRTAIALGAAGTASARCAVEFLRRRPDAVVGFGGYVSAPALVAARSLGIPTAIHEQNAVIGRANRWLARHVDRIFASYEGSCEGLSQFLVEWSGMPVRAEVVGQEARPGALGLKANLITIFFLGGSQGARRLCHAAVECIRILHQQGRRFQVILQTGEAHYAEVNRQTFTVPAAVTPFLVDIGNAYACADLVVARAGASSVAEIAANALPAVFVPYPFATEDHQRKNVERFVRAGAARLIADNDLTGPRLAEELVPLIENSERRAQMAEAIQKFAQPGAAARIAQGVLGLARRNETKVLKPQKESGQG